MEEVFAALGGNGSLSRRNAYGSGSMECHVSWGGGGCLPWDSDVSKGALAEATVTLGSLSLSVAPHPD